VKLFSASITNSTLAKLFTMEALAGFCSGLVLVGILWANLNSSVAGANFKADHNAEKLSSLSSDVSDLKADTGIIKVNQANVVQQIEKLSAEVARNSAETAQEMRIQREDIKKVLQMLSAP
jgi:hypothetical protein